MLYRVLLLGVLVLGSPWWLVRMLRKGRYRAGVGGRLGSVPMDLREACARDGGRGWIWVHAVSVGEVLAASGLVAGLLEAGFRVAVSTTTEAGQDLAKVRFAGCPVFYMPLDFAVLVGRYLGVIRPRLVVTMESELWPNLIHACKVRGVSLAVVNARVSDRSFPRYMLLRRIWGPLLREISLFLAQSEETAGRLRAMGVAAERVKVSGNLKYDVGVLAINRMAELILAMAGGRKIIVAGSTLGRQVAHGLSEDEMVIQAWKGAGLGVGVLLVLAPRHPDRFAEVRRVASAYRLRMGSELAAQDEGRTPPSEKDTKDGVPDSFGSVEIVVLDTIGDLAGVYGVADLAFVGGSLVDKGGHNPLEPARFGVPVVMGESYFNFREIVGTMVAEDALRIVGPEGLRAGFVELLKDGKGMGERGKALFEAQAGATGRTVAALAGLVEGGR